MRLTGPEFAALESALCDASTNYDDLRLTLRRAGKRLEDITPPAPVPVAVLDVIAYAESRDWVHDLIGAARASNPSNVRLLELAAAVGLEPGGVAIGADAASEALVAVSAHLERMVDPDRGIADLGSFAIRLQELLRRVCAVELGKTYGTGMLIGPDTILTNYHVVESAITGAVDPSTLRFRFDYQRLRDGLTTNAGIEVALADDWLVGCAKYSGVDTRPYDESRVPTDDELDYAVLRTRDKVGLLPASGPGGAQRGWIVPLGYEYEFPLDSFLMVVQHPCHDPISFDDAHDAVLRVNVNRTRVHYRTNTLPGSSGSPVLNRDLELVALHHSGEPGGPDFRLECHQQVSRASYNEGIPIAKIQAHLAARQLAWVFGSATP